MNVINPINLINLPSPVLDHGVEKLYKTSRSHAGFYMSFTRDWGENLLMNCYLYKGNHQTLSPPYLYTVKIFTQF